MSSLRGTRGPRPAQYGSSGPSSAAARQNSAVAPVPAEMPSVRSARANSTSGRTSSAVDASGIEGPGHGRPRPPPRSGGGKPQRHLGRAQADDLHLPLEVRERDPVVQAAALE